MKRYIGVIVVVVVICAAIFWCGRIYSINHGYIDNTQVVEAGEAIECDGLVIRCVEAHIYSIDDYKTRFGVDNVETLSSEDRFVCSGDPCLRCVKTVEQHQHRKIACLEEIAYLNGWVSREEVLEVYEVLKKNQYGQYLKDVLDGKYQEHLY